MADNITDAINDVGTGECLYKVDISDAFCHVKIDPFVLIHVSHLGADTERKSSISVKLCVS